MTVSPLAPGNLPISVSLDDPEPMYRQIESELRRLILGGHLPPETRLPSVRALASDLACSVITTRRAYQELEAEGFIRPRQGMGTVVAELPEQQQHAFRREPVEAAFRGAIREGLRAGLTDTEIREIFEATIAGSQGMSEKGDGDA